MNSCFGLEVGGVGGSDDNFVDILRIYFTDVLFSEFLPIPVLLLKLGVRCDTLRRVSQQGSARSSLRLMRRSSH